ncbi:MAG: hypothetical protein LBI17_02515 [Rickettsiales bacterium]|jgi:uncharacterized protein|nr:hypothetical protein [Rickettsiales bacterium]
MKKWVLAAALAFSPLAARAGLMSCRDGLCRTSFDCGGKLTPSEKIVCGDRDISELDVAMAELYKLVKEKPDIAASQREWLAKVRKMADRDEIYAAYRDRVKILDAQTDDYWALADYSWDYRPGAAHVDSGSSFNAAYYKISEDGEKRYDGKDYIMKFTREGCKAEFDEVVKEEYENSKDCSERGSICYEIKGNIVEKDGYRVGRDEYHCVPAKAWSSVKAKAEAKCWTNPPMCSGDDNDPDDCDMPKETPCPDYVLSLDRAIFKADDLGALKKCADYKPDSLYVCGE